MGVSKNSGTTKSSILIGFFHYKPSILGYPYFWNPPYQLFAYHSVVLDAIFPQRRPPGPEVLDAHAKGAVAWAQLWNGVFQQPGPVCCTRLTTWAFETPKNVGLFPP